MGIFGGFGYDYSALPVIYGASTGMVAGTNPPYAVADFVAFYPKFGTVGADDTYTGPLPLPVIQAYVSLASASLMQARYRENWPIVMALFVAHFCTLYLDSEAAYLDNPTGAPTAAAIAASGAASGIAVSQSAGDVSYSIETLTSQLGGWGTWNLTRYGQQFVTMARVTGMGPIFI